MSEKGKAVRKFLVDQVLDVATAHTTEELKKIAGEVIANEVLNMGVDFLTDFVVSSIPLIGGAIGAYKRERQYKNLQLAIQELQKDNDEIKRKFDMQSPENKIILDQIFELTLEKAAGTMQQEKIEFFIHGYKKMLDLENPSFDTAFLYMDILDKLTLLEISVLRFSFPQTLSSIYNNEESESVDDILKKFNIDSSQFKVMRENLLRMGLLEDDYDNKISKDIENMNDTINEIKTVTKSILDALTGKMKKPKFKSFKSSRKNSIKAKQRLKMSKFGYDFFKFFLQNEKQ